MPTITKLMEANIRRHWNAERPLARWGDIVGRHLLGLFVLAFLDVVLRPLHPSIIDGVLTPAYAGIVPGDPMEA
jgi:hypothetical protein